MSKQSHFEDYQIRMCRASLQTRPESVESEDSTDTVTILVCHTELSRRTIVRSRRDLTYESLLFH